MNKLIIMFLVGATLAACDLDVPDLNDPGIDQLEESPNRANVTAACTGLLIGNRAPHGLTNGYESQLGVLGREAYVLEQADPRLITEFLSGGLNPGSPFGGGFWAQPYANIRLANIIQRVVDRVPDFSPAERASILGFTRTIEALDLLLVIVTHDANGAVIDTDHALGEGLGAIEHPDVVYAEIARMLDEGATDLAAGGDAFPFPLTSGYAGFDTPATFRTFNRAMRARVAVYMGDPDAALDALAESFLAENVMTLADLNVGVYHTFSTASGDAVNGLISPSIYVHPSIETSAQMQPGGALDDRFLRKVEMTGMPGSLQGLTSDLVFTIYDGPGAPIPIIRNEELLLLRAEARLGNGDLVGAREDLDRVRTVSGGLAPLTDTPEPSAVELRNEVIYNRIYSLLFEGGHRWIDARRFGILDQLPLDLSSHVRNARYPIPLAECNARPADEPACAGGTF